MSNPFDTPTPKTASSNPFDVATPAGNFSVPDILKSPVPTPVNFSAINVRPPVAKPFDETPLGYTTNFFAAIPESLVNTLTDVFHGVTRFAGSYAVSANDIFHGGDPSGNVDFGKVGDSISPILGSVMRGLYGTDPVPDVATRLKDTYNNPIVQQIASKLPANPAVSDPNTNQKLNAVKIAVLGVIGGDALNFLGGGAEAVEKEILKSTADDTSFAILKRLGLSDEVATHFAPAATAANTPEDAQALLNTIKLQRGAEAVSEAATTPSTPLSKQIQEQFPELPPAKADSIAKRAITETDRTPAAVEAFVQKEVEAYKPSVVNSKTLSEQESKVLRAQQRFQEAKARGDVIDEAKGLFKENGTVYSVEGESLKGNLSPAERLVADSSIYPLPNSVVDRMREANPSLRDWTGETPSPLFGGNNGEKVKAFDWNKQLTPDAELALNKVYFDLADAIGAERTPLPSGITGREALNEISRAAPLGQQEEYLSQASYELKKIGYTNFVRTSGKYQPSEAYKSFFGKSTPQIAASVENAVPKVSKDAAPETAEEAAAGYWDEVISKLKGTGKTIEVSGDEMKRFYHGDYAPEKSDMYSKASYDIMKRLSADPEVKTIAWLGGGPGAGKSEILGRLIKENNLADVLYDNSLSNAKGARELINLQKKNGKQISVDAILANLEEAKKHTILREAATGRGVPDEVFADRHTKFVETLKELLQDGTLSKDEVRLYDLRSIRSTEEAKQLINMGISQEDPLAVLKKLRYDAPTIQKSYGRERFTTSKNRPGNENAGELGQSGRLSGTNRADNGSGSGRLEDQNTGREAAIRAANDEGRISPEARAAQEEAAATAGPKVIRDTIPLPKSVGEIMLENGRSVPIGQTPADNLAAIAKGPDAKSWQSLVRGYMYNAGPTKRAHVLDYLATPEFVLEKVGLGKGAEMLHDAQDSYLSTLKKEFVQMEKWRTEVAESLAQKYRMTEDGTYVLDQEKGLQVSEGEAARSIFRYLDGREREAYPEMNPTVLKVAREMRAYLKDWAKRLNLPEDNQISRYVTHIFERDFSGPPEETFVDPELASIMSDNVAKSVYDPFLLKRTGKPGYIEDVWRAMDAYIKRASRKEAMDPALEELSNMAKSLDDRTYNYVKKLSHRVNMRPTELEQSVDSLITQTPIGHYFTNRPVAFLSRKLRQIFYRGTLGLNFSSALRNLTQGANTYAKLGEKYTTIGYAKLFSRMLSRNLDELYEHNILSDALVQDRNIGMIKKGAQKVDKALFSLFDVAEKINRGSAYFGAKSKAIAKGFSEEEAIKYAKRMVRETQFAFGAVDTPVALNDDVVKTFTQLQSYNLKQIEFLGRMLKQKDFAGLTRWTAGTLAMLYTIGRLFGMTAGQIIPTVGLGGAPFTSTMLAIPGLFSSDPQVKAKAQSQLQRNLATLFPAGAQIRKTLGGLSDLNRGKSVTPTGKFRYRVGPEDAAQALLFGSSALPQAQKYYNSLGKKKTGSSVGNPFD